MDVSFKYGFLRVLAFAMTNSRIYYGLRYYTYILGDTSPQMCLRGLQYGLQHPVAQIGLNIEVFSEEQVTELNVTNFCLVHPVAGHFQKYHLPIYSDTKCNFSSSNK